MMETRSPLLRENVEVVVVVEVLCKVRKAPSPFSRSVIFLQHQHAHAPSPSCSPLAARSLVFRLQITRVRSKFDPFHPSQFEISLSLFCAPWEPSIEASWVGWKSNSGLNSAITNTLQSTQQLGSVVCEEINLQDLAP